MTPDRSAQLRFALPRSAFRRLAYGEPQNSGPHRQRLRRVATPPRTAQSGISDAAIYQRILVDLIIAVQELLDESGQNTYLRMRLLARRLVLTTAALVVALLGLFLTCPIVPANGLPPTLTNQAQFLQAALLGALGALLSFALGSIRRGVDYRIYELASGNIATTLARILVGSSSALVAISATQMNLLPIRSEWSTLVGVAGGFSERLARRVVESLSESAEESPEQAENSSSSNSDTISPRSAKPEPAD